MRRKAIWAVVFVASALGFALALRSCIARSALDYGDNGQYFDPEQGITISSGGTMVDGFFAVLLGGMAALSLLMILYRRKA
jgi:hypothetical protein